MTSTKRHLTLVSTPPRIGTTDNDTRRSAGSKEQQMYQHDLRAAGMARHPAGKGSLR